MIPFLLLGAALFVGATVALATYWKNIVNLINLTKEALKGITTFIQKTLSRIKNIIIRFFQKDNGQWMKETTTQEVSENDVPPEILAKANKSPGQEVETTKIFQKELLKLEQ